MQKRDWLIVLSAAVFALLGVFAVARGNALETGSWGLSFQQEGETPVGNAGAEQLRRLDAVYVDSSGEKVLYLTFDAGYENGCTAKILDVLQAHGVKATFFVVGSYVQRNADLVRRMVAEGHTVGNHTMHHYDMTRITNPEDFTRELQELENAYSGIIGEPMPKFYRPPCGVYSEENLKTAQSLGYHTIFWSLAYVDWKQDAQPTREEALGKLLPRTHPGAIVLLHSTSTTNAEILDELLTEWENMGYRFGELRDLF